jgi:hypothetical protein
MQARGSRTTGSLCYRWHQRIRNSRKSGLSALLCAAALLHGCATNTQSVPIPTPGGPPLNLIESPDPANLSITTAEHPEATGSAESTVLFAGKMRGFGVFLEQATKPLGFHPGVALTEALTAELSRSGRAPARVASKQSGREEFVEDYPALGAKPGVLLDVVPVAVGYWNKYPDGPFRPWVVLAYREYDPAQRKVVATGRIGTGPAIDRSPMIAVPADDQFAFASFDALTADPQRAVAGMKSAIQKVAQALSQKL